MTTPDEEPTNILVVDDLPEKLLVYRAILGELNQNMITARSGEDALRAVLTHDFAVILLDVNMPGMSGLEAAAMIRRRKRSAHTPIIFLSAFADEMRTAEGYAQGAVDYITTPVVPAILRAKVRVFVDLYRMAQQVRRQAEERMRREAAEEANRRLAFLAHVGAVLGGSLDQQVTANDTVRLALAVPANAAALVLLAPDGRGETVIRGQATLDGPVVEVADRAALDPALAAAVERASAGTSPVTGPETVLAVPLRARGRVFAVLALSRQASQPFTAADVTLVETFASRGAMALENARLYHELRQADLQKNEFLSMLAHELRNPLAPIRNASEVLRHKGGEPARVRWAQEVIDRQLSHLVRLVDDLLDVSRLTLGKIRLVVEQVPLASVVEQAVEATRPLLDQCRHTLEYTLPPEPVWLTGDKARLTQVVMNLLNNSAKYTDPGGRIWLSATLINPTEAQAPEGPKHEIGSAMHAALSAPPAAYVEIRVRDNGIGIAPELLTTVFDLFTQAGRSLDRSQGGLGVGLTLVRRLIELHGGSVEAHSAGLGKGSEFVVRLPVVAGAGQQPAPSTNRDGTREAPAVLRVVVIDDNVDGAESLATLIGLVGHEVRVAHDGPTGIALVREFDPDLVLLDIGLPGMDGYEVARQLRGEPGIRCAFVAVSGYGRDEDRQMSQVAGFDQHFVKPVSFSTLQALFESRLAGRRDGATPRRDSLV